MNYAIKILLEQKDNLELELLHKRGALRADIASKLIDVYAALIYLHIDNTELKELKPSIDFQLWLMNQEYSRSHGTGVWLKNGTTIVTGKELNEKLKEFKQSKLYHGKESK